jgi:hypothetical protein
MGLIKELVLLPVAPLRFTGWVAEQLQQEAERRHGGPASVSRELHELDVARDRGELEPEEAERRQGEAIERIADPVAGPGEEERDA